MDTRSLFVVASVSTLLAVGCGPPEGGPDADTTPISDTDSGESPNDTTLADADTMEDSGTSTDTGGPCGGATCGTNATCQNDSCTCKSGYEGDPYSKCTEKNMSECSSRDDCGSHALCVDGSCECEPGFQPGGGENCTRQTVGKPSNRSKGQVCQRWTSRTTDLASSIWETSPTKQCDAGELTERVQWEALEHTNLYRWLLGLDPAGSDPGYIAKTQECATVLKAKGTLSHQLDSSDPCYTDAAADAASSSNLAMMRPSKNHPAHSVRQYIRDSSTPSLGHRRWIFSPSVGATGFGQRGRFSCMYAFDQSGPDKQTDVFYPAPGPFPKAAIHGPWSYSNSNQVPMDNATVEVVDVGSGQQLTVKNVRALDDRNFGRNSTLSWDVPDASAGTTYRVTIENLGGGQTKSYETTLVTCP